MGQSDGNGPLVCFFYLMPSDPPDGWGIGPHPSVFGGQVWMATGVRTSAAP